MLIFQHISAYVNGGKSQLLLVVFYAFMTVWLFGFMIAYYTINPDSINNLWLYYLYILLSLNKYFSLTIIFNIIVLIENKMKV